MHHHPRILALAALFTVFGSPVLAQPGMAQAVLKDANGATRGTATLTETKHGVLIDLDVSGLSPNTVMAFHVHEKGVCDGKDGFQSAGGHFNPDKDDHGYHAEKGYHAGDMPNQFVASDGRLRSQAINKEITLKSGDDESVFDKDGSALVLHSKPDDFTSQPAGDAGSRVLCGVIVKPQ